jgi:hypothetical protein
MAGGVTTVKAAYNNWPQNSDKEMQDGVGNTAG